MITVIARDYSFEVPETIPAGRVKFVLRNEGFEAHSAQLYRLNDEINIDRFRAAMDDGIASEREVATVLGGPANVDRGKTGPPVEVLLEPGDYVVVCWLLGAGGTAHAFRNMVQTFRVTSSADRQPTSPPTDGTFELSEYEIVVPEDFDGTGRYRVVNRGGEWHELVILKLGRKQSADDALAHITGARLQYPPPYTSRGGVSGLEVGGEAVLEMDLQPGKYLLYCAVPDVHEVYHARRGMWKVVSVN